MPVDIPGSREGLELTIPVLFLTSMIVLGFFLLYLGVNETDTAHCCS